MKEKDDELIRDKAETIRNQTLKTHHMVCDVIEKLKIEPNIIKQEINNPSRPKEEIIQFEKLHDKRLSELKGFETQRE